MEPVKTPGSPTADPAVQAEAPPLPYSDEALRGILTQRAASVAAEVHDLIVGHGLSLRVVQERLDGWELPRWDFLAQGRVVFVFRPAHAHWICPVDGTSGGDISPIDAARLAWRKAHPPKMRRMPLEVVRGAE